MLLSYERWCLKRIFMLIGEQISEPCKPTLPHSAGNLVSFQQ